MLELTNGRIRSRGQVTMVALARKGEEYEDGMGLNMRMFGTVVLHRVVTSAMGSVRRRRARPLPCIFCV